jgi:hypothetical protein
MRLLVFMAVSLLGFAHARQLYRDLNPNRGKVFVARRQYVSFSRYKFSVRFLYASEEALLVDWQYLVSVTIWCGSGSADPYL